MTEAVIHKCQWCIERQLETINDAVALYLNQPICEACMSPILANKENVQSDSIAVSYDSNSLDVRLERAKALLDNLETTFENFPISAEEVLSNRDAFYNHRAPALINCTNEQIKELINKRKAVLFAIRIKDERWSTLIEQIKQEERVARGLTGVAKSIKEKIKKPTEYASDQAKKLAKMLGISVTQLESMGAAARKDEFAGIVGKENVEKAIESKTSDATTAKQALANIKAKVQGSPVPQKGKIDPITGRRIE